ncbi:MULTISPECIES: SIR2 family protein [unclassified Pseudomonas]|uniref:SIR2 family NAD-dependent protein deacylase n=1 Tax=unclassified Pseudomonas TaxID=196821 RepID=UPI000A1ED007|nr:MULTISPECIES: SIR2 family protein [unclassified Pseudomonas]
MANFINDKCIADLIDYATLKKLASALWRQENAFHGAAIMVGAGFSRCGATSGNKDIRLPLWFDLAKKLAKDIDASVSSDPLRLAEEYCAFFGRQSLQELIKREVNDGAWSPGELHENLLQLPWSEVLTTNWDTLLERSSIKVNQPVYSVVNKQGDLSSARSPRIVKLHGTVDVTDELVFTQEDYRRYPENNAAFVNFARQVFIENELCLLGFSGDDPNFLQWAGWVRDHLSKSARRIYLVGPLALTAAKRKYLESINIAPVDLSELVEQYDDQDAKHLEATNIFIKALYELKPKESWEWSPVSLLSTDTVEMKLNQMREDRETYPGWVICPAILRWQLQRQISEIGLVNPVAISALSVSARNRFFYEVAWRINITFEVIPYWLSEEMIQVCDSAIRCEDLNKKQQVEIAVALLKNSKWLGEEESVSTVERLMPLIKSGRIHWPESANESLYYDLTMARDRFDYAAMSSLVKELSEDDPCWKLRKASLLAELGKLDSALKLVMEARRELLEHYRNNRGSIYILSRLALASWLLRCVGDRGYVDKLPREYRDWKCDIWDHIDYVRNKVNEYVEKQKTKQGILPSFEPGYYRDNSKVRSFSNEVHPAVLLDGIASVSGISYRWGNCNLLSDHATKLADSDELESERRFALVIRSASIETSRAIKTHFSRVSIACLNNREAGYLIDLCMAAIDFWVEEVKAAEAESAHVSLERLRIFMEVLARASVRANSEVARSIYLKALSLGKAKSVQHVWLTESLRHLLKYSLESIPTSDRGGLISETLSFPMKSETKLADFGDWPNPVIDEPGDRLVDSNLDFRIREIISAISLPSKTGASALLRIIPLAKSGFLKDDELDKLSHVIWGEKTKCFVMPKIDVSCHYFFSLPSPDERAVNTLVRQHVFHEVVDSLSEDLLINIINSAVVKEFPSASQAESYFDVFTGWRPKKVRGTPYEDLSDQDYFGDLIGTALANSILPVLPESALSAKNFYQLKSFFDEVRSPKTIIALSYFAAQNEIFACDVDFYIRRGLRSTNPTHVGYSSQAVMKWRELRCCERVDGLIRIAVSLIGANRTAGLTGILWVAHEMYLKDYLSASDIEVLREMSPVIFDNANYQLIEQTSQEAVTVSLLRAACVRLAHDLLKKNDEGSELRRIIEESKSDPLPEVRHVLVGVD